MGKRYVPKRLMEIDLKKYGGEGTLTVRPKTTLMESKVLARLAELARGIGVSLRPENRMELEALFSHDIMIYLIKLCIVVPEGEPEITESELFDYPDELIQEITDLITGSEEFPLVQNPGEGSKSV